MIALESLIIDLPEDIKNLVFYGDYDEAMRLINIYLDRNIPQILKQRLQLEKERLNVMKKSYIYSYDKALKMGQEKIKNFTKEKLDTLKDERYADWAYVNGEIMFHSRFLENIMKVYPNIDKHLIKKEKIDEKKVNVLNKTVNEIIEKGEKNYFIHVKTGIKLKEDLAKIGEKIKVHLPIPKEAKQIKNINIINSSIKPTYISPEDYPQRTIYFEKEVTGDDIFTVEYSYENHIGYNKLDPKKVSKKQPDFYTNEHLPHIRFTPLLVNLTKEIIKDETNPLLKARKIYDYITKNVQYSFVRPYFGIENIPEYAALNLKGDCGVQALLFITMCRIVNIPARWQSGLYVNPYSIGCHDWAQFYIEPYGWLFADLSFGGSAYRTGNKIRWNYYFGNLDPFRMVANSEFQYAFKPEKKYLRLDPYDNQVGEGEYLDRGLHSDEFETIMEIIDIHEI